MERNTLDQLSRAICLWAAISMSGSLSVAQTVQPKSASALLEGAELVGEGRIAVYRKAGRVLLSIPVERLEKPFLWYSELVGTPVGVVTQALEVSSHLAQFERHGNSLLVRDLSVRATIQAGAPSSGTQNSDQKSIDHKIRPIDAALNLVETGPALVAFAIEAEAPDGKLLIDVTKVFSNDIPGVSGRKYAALSGVVPAAVDPERSYIDKVQMTDRSLNIRTHITFLGANPSQPADGPFPVSIVMGHSFIFLPQTPMAVRYRDPRVGFMDSPISNFEAVSGAAFEGKAVIARFRLEKANPNLEISDPVKPITFYIGPGIPERWRPYVKAGVEKWLPAFRAAGFSNAIRAIDAPSPAEDPNWSVEDASINVIRWLPQNRVNAMGPHVIDPRSGETLAAHILVWPAVIDYFSKYYFALFSTLDPAASKLPLSNEKMGELMTYIVAHEVGHSIGLRHNHIASTAYTVQQLRDPNFANQYGPNSSIMAYGRFNQAAQPGDGVKQFHATLGPYDFAAIKWGYGDFGSNPASSQKALDAAAAVFDRDRKLNWGAGELPEEMVRSQRDPRVLTENVGADRILATQLGIANLLRSLSRLDEATSGDSKLFIDAYNVILSTHITFLKSIGKLVAGTMPRYGEGNGSIVDLVSSQEQRSAVVYLLGDGVKSLEPYRNPASMQRAQAFGGGMAIDELQAGMISDLLNGPNLWLLERQSAANGNAYSPSQLGRDIAEAVWGDLKTASIMQRALQRGYIRQSQSLMEDWAKAGSSESAGIRVLGSMGYPPAIARMMAETGDNTIYRAWLRVFLPTLKTRLDTAAQTTANENDRLHFSEMALQIDKLSKMTQ